jgi:hypothetical protein
MYEAYNIGYAMPLSEITFLFFIGLMYAIAFRITKNIFILWPLFQPMGQLVTLIKDDLQLPLITSLGFIEVQLCLDDRFSHNHVVWRCLGNFSVVSYHN